MICSSGIMRKNSVSGSSSGSQERANKGVTFASDYSRIVSLIANLLFIDLVSFQLFFNLAMTFHFVFSAVISLANPLAPFLLS